MDVTNCEPLFLSCLVDVIVHRLLAASLGIYQLPGVFQDRPKLTSISDSKYCFSLCLTLRFKCIRLLVDGEYMSLFLIIAFMLLVVSSVQRYQKKFVLMFLRFFSSTENEKWRLGIERVC